MKRLLLITGIAVVSFAQAFAATTSNDTNAPAQVSQPEEECENSPQLMLASQCTMTPDQSKQPTQETTPATPAEGVQPAKMLLAGSCPSSDQCQQKPAAPKNGEKAEEQKAVQPQLLA